MRRRTRFLAPCRAATVRGYLLLIQEPENAPEEADARLDRSSANYA